MKNYLLAIIIIGLTGCVTVNEEKAWSESKYVEMGEILVFRDSGSHSGKLGMYIGSENNYVTSIDVNEYTKLHLPKGENTLRINTHLSVSDSLVIKVNPNETKCIMGKANDLVWLNILIIPTVFIPRFTLSEIKCPIQSKISQKYQVIR
jgi:hypothetical protein